MVTVKNERGGTMSYRPPGTPDEYRTRNGIVPRGKRTWRYKTVDGKQIKVPSTREAKNIMRKQQLETQEALLADVSVGS
jgi:hypothetical protein